MIILPRTYATVPKNLISKVQTLKEKYNVDNFWFLDEGCPSQTAMSFAEELNKQNIKIYWSLRTRINDNWTYENLSYLYNNGLREMWIGLEHTSPRILEIMNKTNRPKEYSAIASRIFNDATTIGIGLHFCHILGFPSETEMDRSDVMNFYIQHLDAISKKPFFTTFNIFGLMYDSPMYKNPNKFGISEINENDNGFYMIKVPYKTIYNDETDNLIQLNLLSTWIQRYLRTIVKNQNLLQLWSCIADTPMELLMKKHYKSNPFYEK